MNYLTKYYKNLSEELQAKVNYLQNLLESEKFQYSSKDTETQEFQGSDGVVYRSNMTNTAQRGPDGLPVRSAVVQKTNKKPAYNQSEPYTGEYSSRDENISKPSGINIPYKKPAYNPSQPYTGSSSNSQNISKPSTPVAQPDPFTDPSQMTPEMIRAVANQYGNVRTPEEIRQGGNVGNMTDDEWEEYTQAQQAELAGDQGRAQAETKRKEAQKQELQRKMDALKQGKTSKYY